MPTIARKEVAPLTEMITLVLNQAEVQAKFKSELQRFKNKASIKGFRQGKAPDSFVKKMYGQNMLMDIVNNMMQSNVNDYLQNEKLDIIGQPIPSEESPRISFNPDAITDYEFNFDIGFAPVIDIAGLDKDTNITKYLPTVTDEMAQAEMDRFMEESSAVQQVEGIVMKGDRLLLSAVSEDGSIEKEFSVLVDDMPAEARAEFLNTSKDGSVTWSIYDLEEGKDAAFVHKYMLGTSEDAVVAPMFTYTVKEINRKVARTFDEATLIEVFGPEVTTIEQGLEIIKGEIARVYYNQAMSLCYRDLQDIIIEKNKLELPDNFLKRWLKATSEKNTDEVIARDYERFSTNMRWTLLRDKVIADNNIQLFKEEILDAFKRKISGMFGGGQGIDDATLTSIAKSFMENEKGKKEQQEIADDIMFNKVFSAMYEKVSVTEQYLTMEEFSEMNRLANEAAKVSQEGVTELQDNMEDELGEGEES